MKKKDFKSRNGDTLDDLNARKTAADERLRVASDKLDAIMAKASPLKKEVDDAWMEARNIEIRLINWWAEAKKKGVK